MKSRLKPCHVSWDFTMDLDTAEEFVTEYKTAHGKVLEIIERVRTLNRNIPVNTWSGAGRNEFNQSILAWLLRMEKLELELLYTIMIVNYSGGKSNALRKCSDGYVDIII